MLTAADLDAAWELFVGLRDVTYVPYANVIDDRDLTAEVRDIPALFQQRSKTEETSPDGAAVNVHRRTWSLRASRMPGVEVTRRGVIREACGKEWAVESAKLLSWGTRWECECHARG